MNLIKEVALRELVDISPTKGGLRGSMWVSYEHRPETASAWLFIQALASSHPCDLGQLTCQLLPPIPLL